MAFSSPLSETARLVRELDPERFATALFAPEAARRRLLALYAFNVEISRVRESAREAMAGMIRLQWWRDVVSAIADGTARDLPPVASELAAVLGQAGVSMDLVMGMIDARERDLDPSAPADLAEAEDYARRTSGALSRLAAQSLGLGPGAAQDAVEKVGTAWGLIGHARAVPFHLSIGRLTLPEAALAEAGSSGAAVMAGTAPKPALAHAARALAERGRDLLAEARGVKVPKSALAAALSARQADAHLADLRRAGWDPFHPRASLRRTSPARLAISHLLGRF